MSGWDQEYDLEGLGVRRSDADSTDCVTCGARQRHQRRFERRCAWCDSILVVKSERSIKRFCDRQCQLANLRKERNR